MISTMFENMTDPNLELVTVLMEYPVRVGDHVEFNSTSWIVHAVTWCIETNPHEFTRTVTLHVRIK